MKLLIAVSIVIALLGESEPIRPGTHPRIWLTPSVLSALRVKAGSGDRDWLHLKAEADRLLTRHMPRFTLTGATNSNPVQFTMAEPVPWRGSTPLFVGGATGVWAAVNTTGDRPSPTVATRVGRHTFTVPLDSTGWGSFTGQRVVVFFSEGAHSAYGYNGSDWQWMLEVLGLAYQVTGDVAYARKGIELLDYIASLGVAGMLAPAALDSGFPSRSAIYGLAIGYDWLHDRLTLSQRVAVARAVNLWFDWFKRAAFENNGPAYGNYFGGHVLGFGLAGFATEADNPRGPEMVAHIRGLFETHVPPAFANGGFAGGFPVEGYGYGANHFQRLLLYMRAVETATGAEMISTNGYAHKIARHLLYALKPSHWQVSDEGAWPGDVTGVSPPSLPIVLASLLVGTDEGRWMQHLQHSMAAASPHDPAADAFVRFLFDDRGRPAADYRRTQPTWFRSPGDEHFYRRSSWRPDAVWSSIAAGATHWAGHQFRGAGHIAIQRGNDYLLVNSGQWKGANGVSGMPQAFDLRSWRGNTLFVDDFGDYLFDGDDYRGGQGYWGSSRVLAHDGGPDFGYIKTDLTTAYSVGARKPWDSRSVRYFYRSFLSMGNGVVLVFDRMRFLHTKYIKKLYFHVNPTGGAPAISKATASIRAGRSALFIRTLVPAAPVLAVEADPVSATDGRTITYRLEIADSIPSATFNALNVLVATASSTHGMPATVRVQSADGTMVGAMVMDDRVQRIGLFSEDGAPQSSVRYIAHYPQGQTGVHVIADMVPNTPYVLARDGVRIGTGTASSGGVLVFQTSRGGLFTLRTQSRGRARTALPARGESARR